MKKQGGFFRNAMIVFSAVGFLLFSGLALAADEQNDTMSPGQSMMDGKDVGGGVVKAKVKKAKKAKKTVKKAKKSAVKGKKKAKKAKRMVKSEKKMTSGAE